MGRVSIGVGVVIFASFLSVTSLTVFPDTRAPDRCDELQSGTEPIGTHFEQPQRRNYQTIRERATICHASATCYSYDGVYGHEKNYGRFTGLYHGGEYKDGIAIKCNVNERVNTGNQLLWSANYTSCSVYGTGYLFCVPKKYRKYEIDVLFCPSAATWRSFDDDAFLSFQTGYHCADN